MPKKLCVFFAIFMLLAACGGGNGENNGLADAASRPANPLGAPAFDPFDDSTWDFALLAALEEAGVFLYGGRDLGLDRALLHHNGQRTYFGWPAVSHRGIPPQLMYSDLDGDGENELAVVIHAGAGTGVSVSDLHVLRLERGDSGNIEYTPHSLLASEVREWLTEPMHAEVYAVLDENTYILRFDFAGESHKAELNACFETEGPFVGLTIGSHVWFEFEGPRVTAGVVVGALHENYPAPLHFFGYIQAAVLFDGENFTLDEFSFVLN